MCGRNQRLLYMHANFQLNTVLIGGITGGIGQCLAEQLSASGVTVAGFSRHGSQQPQVTQCDATKPDELAHFFSTAAAQYGQIDAYVHAIGSIYLKPAHLTPAAEWMEVIQQNLSSAFFALSEAIKYMPKQGGGKLLFFSSTAAQTGIASHEAIAAAKGGIEAMIRAAAATYAPRNICINAIAPTLTDTPLSQAFTSNPKSLEISKRMHPLGQIAAPADIASLAHWLLSDHAKLVTGQTFVVDGGLSSIVPKPRT